MRARVAAIHRMASERGRPIFLLCNPRINCGPQFKAKTLVAGECGGGLDVAGRQRDVGSLS
jgi:hypothetical protein